MGRRRLRWIFCVTAPLLLFIFPLKGHFHFNRLFKTIITETKKTGITTLQLYDQERSRPVVTEIWYPIDPDIPAKRCYGFWMRCDEARDAPLSQKSERYPLIIMSHGSGGDRYNICWLAEILTSNGYIVAAMDHFGNTWNNK